MANAQIPDLSLTQGQVIWTLSHGEIPTEPRLQQLLDQIRYLRQLGVPFDEGKHDMGRGNPIRYGFMELMELGVAIFALRRGLRPREVADYLIKHRKDLQRMFRQVLEEQPAKALEAPLIKSHGKIIPLVANEMFLRLHDRFSETPGKFEPVGISEAKKTDEIFGMREVFAGGVTKPLIPLTRIVLELVVWAQEAPEIRPGRS